MFATHFFAKLMFPVPQVLMAHKICKEESFGELHFLENEIYVHLQLIVHDSIVEH